MNIATPHPSDKRHAPAALRNREPIREVLKRVMPETGTVLEIGSGSGEHAVYFASAFPGVAWHATDADPTCVASVDAWAAEANLTNLQRAIRLDATASPWPSDVPDAVDVLFSANVIHIAPWKVAEGLIAGAGRIVKAGGALVLYGPFKINGEHTAPSNAAFDASLKHMDGSFGVRDLADVTAEAAKYGFSLTERHAMPANNFSLIFRKSAAS
jgi:cyclopropane fatty-acyl-phospholipid synthase-like methyltransferase